MLKPGYKRILIEWNATDIEVEDANLPGYIDIPADMPDEDVVPYIISTYGFDVDAWSEFYGHDAELLESLIHN